jgi:hypothetical protein
LRYAPLPRTHRLRSAIAQFGVRIVSLDGGIENRTAATQRRPIYDIRHNPNAERETPDCSRLSRLRDRVPTF